MSTLGQQPAGLWPFLSAQWHRRQKNICTADQSVFSWAIRESSSGAWDYVEIVRINPDGH